jgi:hypothetical protein
MATAQQIIDSVREDIAVDPGKNIWSDAMLLKFLNEAVGVTSVKGDYTYSMEEATITPLVAAQRGYAYAANYRKLLWMHLVDSTAASTQNDEAPLIIVTEHLTAFKEGKDMDLQGDTPGYVYEEEGEFRLYPVPNTAAAAKYTLKYGYSETATTLALGDTPDYPSRWQMVLEHYMRYKMWSRPGSQNAANAASAFSEYNYWEPKARHDIYWKQGDTMTYGMPVLPRKNRK